MTATIVLFRQLGGFQALGEGALKTPVYETKELFVLDERSIKNILNQVKKAGKKLCERPIGSVFSELGSSTPEEVLLQNVKTDRRKLDEIIMGEILGLTENEQLEVYKAVIDLVKSRIDKAKSVKKKGKIKEGVDIEQVSRVIIDKIGKETYRKFYEEKVLSRKELKDVKLFSPAKKPVITIGLFGCEIVAGKERIQCANEEEARYLKVWLDAGLTEEVKVPTDEKYLKRILPKLEELYTNISSIISEHLESITSQKLRNQIIHHLQRKLFGW